MTTPSINPVHSSNHLLNALAEQAQTRVREQIDALRTQKQTTLEATSSLKLLMARFELEKSTLREVVDGYARQSWLEKTTWGLLFIAASALIGSMMNLTLVFTALGAALYYAANVILSNDHDITSRRDARWRQDILAMEADLDASVHALNDAITQFNALQAAAVTQNTQNAEHITAFNDQIDAFTTQTTAYVDTVQQLEHVTATLKHDAEKIAQQQQDAHAAQVKSISNDTTQAILRDLTDTNASLSAKNAELLTLNQQLQSSLATFSQLEVAFQAQFITLTARITDDDVLIERLRHSAKDTLGRLANLADALEEGDEAVLDAERLMHEGDAEWNQGTAIRFFKPNITTTPIMGPCTSRQAM